MSQRRVAAYLSDCTKKWSPPRHDTRWGWVGDQNLNHRRGNPGGELFDRGIELLQHRWGFCRPGSDRSCFVNVGLRRFTTSDGQGLHRYGLANARHRKPQEAKTRSQAKKPNAALTLRTARPSRGNYVEHHRSANLLSSNCAPDFRIMVGGVRVGHVILRHPHQEIRQKNSGHHGQVGVNKQVIGADSIANSAGGSEK